MFFYNKIIIEYKNKNIDLYVDMDGVIADYCFNEPLEFKNKRPLKKNINVLKHLSNQNNINLYILSVCRKNEQIAHKNIWLDINAPFFKKENRIILSKEAYPEFSSKELKSNYLKNHINEKVINIMIDDDNEVLKYIHKNVDNILLFQDSILND